MGKDRSSLRAARRTFWLALIVAAAAMPVGAAVSSAQPAPHASAAAAACPVAGQCEVNPQTNCPLGGPSSGPNAAAPAPYQVSPPSKCVKVPATLFYVTVHPSTGGCYQVLFIQLKLQPGVSEYEATVYSKIGEGTRWWADPSTPLDQTGAATHEGQTYSNGALHYTVPHGYIAWDVGGGGGGYCAGTIAPPAVYGWAGWAVVVHIAPGHGSLSIKGPTHNRFNVNFNEVVSGTASGAANYVVSFEQTPPGSGCASTFLAEQSRFSAVRWPTGSGPVHKHFKLVARFYSRNHLSHAICSYLINRSSGHTYARAAHYWKNA